MRASSYMTAAQYEAYDAIDKLEEHVSRVRRQIERDYRGKRIEVRTDALFSWLDRLEEAVHKWEEEDEKAPTVDEINAVPVSPSLSADIHKEDGR